ncbi:MAG: hypothetical protein RQ801_10100 [Spirochaetaceae bacterium]|nr:hypothetical protein [Spirochaetaceae bacterium]MDT8298641.1 hypothetical protein [Spirochaetaceae bacterium]
MNSMKYGITPYLSVVTSLLMLSACGPFGPTDSIAVKWPEADISALSGEAPAFWELRWLTDEGDLSVLIVDGKSSPVLPFHREYPIILAAYPQDPSLPDGYRIKPAGCLLPAVRAPQSDISLTWENGFAAQKILEMADAGISPRVINLERFADAVGVRSEDAPWDLDQRRLWEDLLAGELWIYSFRLLAPHFVDLPIPSGFWYGEYVPGTALSVGSDGWRGELVEGIHCFFCPMNGGLVIADIDSEGRVTYLIDD